MGGGASNSIPLRLLSSTDSASFEIVVTALWCSLLKHRRYSVILGGLLARQSLKFALIIEMQATAATLARCHCLGAGYPRCLFAVYRARAVQEAACE